MSRLLVENYHKEVQNLISFGGSRKETSIRTAFQRLLEQYCKKKDFVLVPELDFKTPSGKIVFPDGTIKDALRLDWGYWESKDEYDAIDEEIIKKFDKGYPKDNILFEDSQVAVLYQAGRETARVSMQDTDALDRIITAFIDFERPEVKSFRDAIEKFKQDIPQLSESLRELINNQFENKEYIAARDVFFEICKETINPDIAPEDIREMLIQHILTEDIFNSIFDETQFHRENNIARELEHVLSTFFHGEIKRKFNDNVRHYYLIIKAAASGIANHSEKQKFLKIIYENFYKAYSPKKADRLGVVYTPNEIVKFMIESANELCHRHFGKLLSDKNVEILDPAAGTGTYITELIEFLPAAALHYKYEHEIHANEVAILPYYIANLNIEYTYKQKTGQYKEFKNICFVDTLDNVGFAFKGQQIDAFSGISLENKARIKRQNERKISIIIGNPPYNARQDNFNSQNANRFYKEIDQRIKDTYIKNGTAQNQIVVYDMYIRFFRWAMDRLGDEGIIAFISNNSFIDGRAFDGFRKTINDEFNHVYIINLGGNIRELSGKDGIFLNEKNTIFGVSAAVGISIIFLIKEKKKERCIVNYIHPCDIRATRDEKINYLFEHHLKNIPFEHIIPDKKNNWINQSDNDFESLIPLIDKDVKGGKGNQAIFKLFSLGIASHRDSWIYDYSPNHLENKIKYFIDIYNHSVNDDNFINKDKISWDRELNHYKDRKIEKIFEKDKIVLSLFRPFFKQNFYFDRHFNGMIYQFEKLYSKNDKNSIIAVNREGSNKPFHLLATNYLVDLHTTGDSQCLPLYRYTESGERLDNITDWGLEQFIVRYEDKNISKEDIFHYVYAVLHNPEYRKKYELNLKREFPRIPFYDDFRKWANWGEKLMDLHINFESVEQFPLEQIDLPWDKERTPKAKLTADKLNGIINLDEQTSLTGIPNETWEYKLGNRSAVEWILDQHKEKTPKDPTIREKFNNYKFADYKENVIDLIMRVTTVSVETMKIIREMEKE